MKKSVGMILGIVVIAALLIFAETPKPTQGNVYYMSEGCVKKYAGEKLRVVYEDDTVFICRRDSTSRSNYYLAFFKKCGNLKETIQDRTWLDVTFKTSTQVRFTTHVPIEKMVRLLIKDYVFDTHKRN